MYRASGGGGGVNGNPKPKALGVLGIGFEVFELEHDAPKFQFEHELWDTQLMRTHKAIEGHSNPSVSGS